LSMSNPFSGAAAGQPFFNNCAPPYRRLPSSFQWNLTVERALSPSTTLTVGYVANAGRHLETDEMDTDQQAYNIPVPMGVVLGPTQSQTVPFPGFASIYQYQNINTNAYESLQVTLRRRFGKGLTFTAFYTYSKNMTYADYQSDLLDTKVDKGPWGDDLTNNIVISPIWQLPFGRGERFAPSNAVLNKLVSGWEASTIISIHGGFPFNTVLNPDIDLLMQNGNETQDRPNTICNSKLSHPTAAQWYNPACFAMPVEPTTPGAALLPGNTGWNSLRGPSGFSQDLGVVKRTAITEGTSLEFRVEFFNVWNHTVLGIPSTGFDPSANPATEGQVTTPDSLPRIIQLAMKLHF